VTTLNWSRWTPTVQLQDINQQPPLERLRWRPTVQLQDFNKQLRQNIPPASQQEIQGKRHVAKKIQEEKALIEERERELQNVERIKQDA